MKYYENRKQIENKVTILQLKVKTENRNIPQSKETHIFMYSASPENMLSYR